MFSMNNKILSDLILEDVLSEEQVQECLSEQMERGKTLVEIVREKGFASEERLLEILADSLHYPYLPTLQNVNTFAEGFLEKVPHTFARLHHLCAFAKDGGSYLVLTSDPLDLHPLDELSFFLQAPLEIVLAPRHEIDNLLNRLYSQFHPDDDLLPPEDEGAVSIEDQLDALDKIDLGPEIYNQPPIIRLVNRVLLDGLRNRASDIHLQPGEDTLRVRYRIDGILYDVQDIPKRYQDAVISRVKIMGKMNIAERRLPQDGRTTLKKGEGEVDVRISSVPTSHGERIVFRLLDKTVKLYRLNEIGLTRENENQLKRLVHLPNGIIFVTGPTGSGKTTTLYAALMELDSKAKNIITIEDPIEYHLSGISQIQVNPKKGLTFAAGLRSLLRQDPDVMMVGEVRDEETARIAIQSALTGHLVLSTIHTNDSVGAVTRMLDIGIEPYLVSSSVVAVIAQRLVRQICEHCQEEYVPTQEELVEINLRPEQIIQGVLWKGRGCSHCMGTGYLERTAIYEILTMDDVIRQKVMERASAAQIKDYAIKQMGLKTLRMDGAQKVLEGITTIEEVLRVTVMDVL
ncbi:MAG: type II secretion system protein GspE [Planctomycetota bacterium]|nr:MAG: type II secretion system protein GspE [Planctomycetota bacterium]